MNSTTASQGPVLRRFVDWTLDTKGDMYGDEQERLRWYEGITVAASVQWLIVPWMLAFGVWQGGRPVVSYLVAVTLLMFIPQLFSSVYAMRNRVRLPSTQSAKYWVFGLMSGLPYLAIVLGAIRAYDNGFDPAGLRGGAVGAVLGGTMSVLLLRRYNKRVKKVSNGDDE
jgi:hypothetical protein